MSAVLDMDAAYAALAWYVDNDIDDVLGDAPVSKIVAPNADAPVPTLNADVMARAMPQNTPTSHGVRVKNSAQSTPAPSVIVGKQEAIQHAIAAAKAAQTVQDLRESLSAFDGLSIRKTATTIVFSDGHLGADLMIIGDTPNADEDRAGVPFAGQNGALLDKILACINKNRTHDTPQTGAYLTNLVNWRPPGGRTPTPAELQVSLPFIERHIMLAKPKIILICGVIAARALLGTKDSMSKLRGRVHDYTVQTKGLTQDGAAHAVSIPPIPTVVSYHPEQLLRTPAQKRGAWADILMIEEKLHVISQNS